MRYGATDIFTITEINAVTVRNNYSTASQWSRLYKARRVCSGYGEKTVATFTIQEGKHHHFRKNLALNKTGNIADNALNQWLHHMHKTDIIVLSVVLTEQIQLPPPQKLIRAL